MVKLGSIVLLGISFTLMLTACKSDEERRAEEAAKQLEEAGKKMDEAAKSGNLGDAMAALGAAVNASNKGGAVEPVEHARLKEMLPEELSGMKRTESESVRNSAMGMNVSVATGHYAGDASKSLKLAITDMGSMTGLMGMTAFAWANADVNRETASGYEKTLKLGSYKAFEKYDRNSKSGEFAVIVGDRFVVSAEGRGVEAGALRGAVERVDLRKLDGMHNEGRR